jgi:hypothetical protein
VAGAGRGGVRAPEAAIVKKAVNLAGVAMGVSRGGTCARLKNLSAAHVGDGQMQAAILKQWMRRERPTQCELSGTDIALEQLLSGLGGLEEWTVEHQRRGIVERDGNLALVFETERSASVRISCKDKHDEPQEYAAWNVTFDEFSSVRDVADDTGAPLTGEYVKLLNDVLWSFHRLAVEDAIIADRS